MTISEAERLRVLRTYAVMDTAPAPALDRITELARLSFDAPIAQVSLVDERRQWFKSSQGSDACETDRQHAFCAHALPLARGEVMVVEDARADPRFADNPLVTGEPSIRFYAGAVLTSPEGANLGTLCVIDRQPRPPLSPVQAEMLRALARLVMSELEAARIERRDAAQRKFLDMAEGMSGVGRWRLEVATGAVEWSDEVYRIHGVDPAQFDPMLDSALDFYDAPGRAELAGRIEAAIRDRTGYAVQLRIRRADGEWRTVTTRAACELAPSGEVEALIGVFRDVTDEVALLRRVTEEGERYRLLAHNATDVIAVYDAEGRFSYVSPSVAGLIGRAPEALVGMRTYDLIHPDDHAPVAAAFRSLLNSGLTAARIEYRAIRADGSHLWVEAHPTPKRDANGRLTGFHDVVRDVSAHKRLETELVEARQAAEGAARAKADFLANMSHELRTPLTSIVGFVALAAEQPELAPLTRDYVRRVQNASRALLGAVNDILDFSRLEAGQVELRPTATDVVAVCRDAIELFIPQAATKNLALDLRVEEAPQPVVMIDAERLLQLLLNLIGNAVKFTAAGSVRVGVALRRGRLAITVSDTGSGIAPEAIARLFNRFSQVDASSTRQHGGSGLGLAICKGLAERMGGSVTVSSEVGRGSVFTLDVPAAAAAQVAISTLAREEGFESLEALRVLVVDDHPANRDLARLILAGAGAEVSEAGTGAEALELALAQPFDAILLDLRLPDMSGPEVLTRLRARPGPNDATPAVAYARAALGAQPPPQAFDGVAAKPPQPKALLAAIKAAVDYDTPDFGAARAR